MKWRRRYRPGTCQDCGRWRRVTVARFWLNFMRYQVCAECIRPYRGRLLTHTEHERPTR